ncbi:MAG TPA: putative capsular polysaccharide synthesis family protein [Lacunisphaera sp.]|jgi:hypothetical protein
MSYQFHQIGRIRNKYGVFLTKQPVFIYQMGKVGSTAIEESLRAAGVPVQHLHSIGGDLTDQFRLRKSGRSLTARGRRKIEGVLQGILLRIPNRRLKVITLVRDPLGRNISAFFQVLRKILWDNPQFDSRSDEGDCHLLIDAFNRQMQHELPGFWFDREIRHRLGIDVFQHPFDRERGFMLISRGHIDLMIIRAEDLDQCESAIGDFVGRPGLRLFKANCGVKKWYAPLYKNFLEHFSPDIALLDQLYDSRYVRHFYTPEEIAEFRNSWLAPAR